MGFEIDITEVFSPAPAVVAVLKERGLRPHLLVHDDVVPEFDSVDQDNPNCVVLGDAADNFSYQNMNSAFRVLIGLQKPVLFSMGRGRYYKETDGLKLDVGVYMKALEYACDLEAEVVGKPAPMFFNSVLSDMGIQPHEALMIGDDLVNDIGGAQKCGMKGLQVRTGKYSQTGLCSSGLFGGFRSHLEISLLCHPPPDQSHHYFSFHPIKSLQSLSDVNVVHTIDYMLFAI
ncbi:phospholysine phosphohistidine inorganic pyrophosphate phosphatase isoform X3 [Brachyhypopomus gauderio]